MVLVEQEQVLLITVGASTLLVVACENGQQVAEIKERQGLEEPKPILYLDEENSSVYIKEEQASIPFKIANKEDAIRRVFDASFYLKLAEFYQHKIDCISNPNWKFYPKIEAVIGKKV